MAKNIIQKLIDPHLVDGKPEAGSEVGIRIDQTLTQDATGTMTYLQLESLDVPKVWTELSVSYVDHNTLQQGFENFDDHRYLQSVAARYGVLYSRAGNGICHQVHLERFGRPGKTLLGSDSHTPTGGGIGMLAIGAGGLDVVAAMAGAPFYLTYPRVINVRLEGKLKPWVSAKDVILKLLSILTTKGNVGAAIEYSGSGVQTLSVPERATITNMGAELGVTSSVFPSDEETRRFLRAQGREEQWVPLNADPDADYDRTIDIDLGELMPLAACPHSPDNVKTVGELSGIKVDQVLVGSCTNSSLKDLTTIASMLRGRKIHPEVSFGVAPGSRQVLRMITESGELSDIIASGTRILESACGFCIGNGQSPGTNAVSLRTNNRNFEGRSGTKSAQVYLVSPETAVASALTGVFTDPMTLGTGHDSPGMEYPLFKMPERFLLDDSMITAPPEEGSNIEVLRGPNIGSPPSGTSLPDTILGEVTLKVGDKVTTDHIMPAGIRLKYRSNIEKYAQYVFEPVDPTFPERCTKNREKGVWNIVVGGLSYGQGSSREHAAICPAHLGVKVVLAKSLERIHTQNLINFGILPITFADQADYDNVNQGDQLELPELKERLIKGQRILVQDSSRNISAVASLSPRQKDILFMGGLLPFLKERLQ